jgi:transposase
MYKEGLKGLPESVSELQEMIIGMHEKLEGFEQENEFLREQLRLIRLKMFTRVSERFQEEMENCQRLLFADLSDEEEKTGEEEQQEDIVIKEHKRKKTGRRPIPEDLPRIELVHDISEEDKQCACGSKKSRIGEETCEKLQIEPAKLWVERHIRPKYACKKCEGVESDDATVKIAPMPPQMIPKSLSTPSLLGHIFTGKFCDAIPFYRQEQQFKRYGIDINRSTMCNWAFKVADRLKPLVEMLRLAVLSGPLINADETTVQVLAEPDRDAQSKSYIWVFRGGVPGMPVLYYHYAAGRGGKIAKEFLSGYRGYVQTDGYGGYNFLDSNPEIIHVGCWAHVRRKFNDVVKAVGGKYKEKGKGKANKALSIIRELYLIEREAKNRGFDEDQTFQLRQEKSEPIVEELGEWLQENVIKIPPKSLLGKAFNYTLSQWPRLIKYLDNGLVRMDNNLIENAIRPFVVGRKNWLFSVTPEGARASAVFYSLIETAKANGLEPSGYLRYLFKKFPYARTTEDVFNLLPMYVVKGDLEGLKNSGKDNAEGFGKNLGFI